MDLRKKLRLDGAARSKKNRILVTEMNGKVVGLIVDEVSEVLRISPDRVEPPPDMVSSVGAEYITGVGKLEERIILLLDLGKVLDAGEISSMQSAPETQGSRI